MITCQWCESRYPDPGTELWICPDCDTEHIRLPESERMPVTEREYAVNVDVFITADSPEDAERHVRDALDRSNAHDFQVLTVNEEEES